MARRRSEGDARAQLGVGVWVPVLIVERDVMDIGLLLFRERFGLPDDVPAFAEVRVDVLHGRPITKVFARVSMRRECLAKLGIDVAELPLTPG